MRKMNGMATRGKPAKKEMGLLTKHLWGGCILSEFVRCPSENWLCCGHNLEDLRVGHG